MNSVRVGWGRGGRGGGREDLPRLQSFPGLGDTHLHPFHRISERAGLVDEVCMLHIFSESLEDGFSQAREAVLMLKAEDGV